MLEHIDDDEGALRRLYALCGDGGMLAIYVPADQKLLGTMDTVVGHFRRYPREELETKLTSAGFIVDKIFYQNRFGRVGWWWNGRFLRSSHVPGVQSRIFDWLVPILRRVEATPPSNGLSLIALARRPGVHTDRAAEKALEHASA